MARLIDADALMESIGCADAVKYGNRDRAQQDISYRTMMLYEIMDEIDAQPTVGVWISVKDGLPDKGHDVLAFLDDGEETRIAACNYWDGVWFDAVMNTIAKNVVCWMPLPEPPEEHHETD